MSEPTGRPDRRLVFFCPDITETGTLTRAHQFIDQGYAITVFGFQRGRYNIEYAPAWPVVPLGATVDGRYWQRLRALMRAFPTLLRHRAALVRADVFYARNIDQLMLAMLARLATLSRAPIAYEVLDIPPILMKRGVAATMLRMLERLCLRYTRILVLSSPGFHRGYYSAIQMYGGAWFLLENKLHPSIADLSPRTVGVPAPAVTRARRPWVVGYFGLIRGEATLDLITRLADRLRGRVVFRFRGVLTTVSQAKFAAAVRSRPNMVYGGPYRPYRDFEAIYRGVDFAWAIDLEHADHNSRWLLPCRLYESGYFGVPCLTVRGFEVGALVERYRIGWTFDAPLEQSLVRFFEDLTPADYEYVRRRLQTAPTDLFVGGSDVDRLSAILDS